jgi:hypothetical protein
MPSVKGVLKGVFNQESGVTLRKDGLNALADFLADCPDAEQTAAQLFDAALQGVQTPRWYGANTGPQLSMLPDASALGGHWHACTLQRPALRGSGRVSAAGQRK